MKHLGKILLIILIFLARCIGTVGWAIFEFFGHFGVILWHFKLPRRLFYIDIKDDYRYNRYPSIFHYIWNRGRMEKDSNKYNMFHTDYFIKFKQH